VKQTSVKDGLTRPRLHHDLAADEFVRWYWLKAELVEFCRSAKLPTVGVKLELASRVAAYLSGAAVTKPAIVRRTGAMPQRFALATKIGEGWRCNPALGAFLREQCGPAFRFNKAMRDFIHTQHGQPLASAVQCYHESMSPDAPKREIAPQLEYNRHTREFYKQNPGATAAEVRAAWWVRRGLRAGS
jgi:SAP domain-containing new25/Domain of unknown function (DUF6434)